MFFLFGKRSNWVVVKKVDRLGLFENFNELRSGGTEEVQGGRNDVIFLAKMSNAKKTGM